MSILYKSLNTLNLEALEADKRYLQARFELTGFTLNDYEKENLQQLLLEAEKADMAYLEAKFKSKTKNKKKVTWCDNVIYYIQIQYCHYPIPKNPREYKKK